jgi:hypothetical protein
MHSRRLGGIVGPVVWNLSGICSGITIFMLRFCKILNQYSLPVGVVQPQQRWSNPSFSTEAHRFPF